MKKFFIILLLMAASTLQSMNPTVEELKEQINNNATFLGARLDWEKIKNGMSLEEMISVMKGYRWQEHMKGNVALKIAQGEPVVQLVKELEDKIAASHNDLEKTALFQFDAKDLLNYAKIELFQLQALKALLEFATKSEETPIEPAISRHTNNESLIPKHHIFLSVVAGAIIGGVAVVCAGKVLKKRKSEVKA
jgi:hypothetical protein